jgi:hypothetical protein
MVDKLRLCGGRLVNVALACVVTLVFEPALGCSTLVEARQAPLSAGVATRFAAEMDVAFAAVNSSCTDDGLSLTASEHPDALTWLLLFERGEPAPDQTVRVVLVDEGDHTRVRIHAVSRAAAAAKTDPRLSKRLLARVDRLLRS